MTSKQREEVLIVGGGLAGLTAAARLAREGLPATVLEGAADVGGRARVRQRSGFTFNLGPHAVYRQGAGRGLASLGVRLPGRRPPVAGALAVQSGDLVPLPGSAVSLLTDRFLTLRGKLQVARFFGFVLARRFEAYATRPLEEVLAERASDPSARAYLSALFRVSTYSNAPALVSAEAALRQLHSALTSGVLYVDGGWRTITDQLRATVEAGGGHVVTSAHVKALERDEGGFALRLRDGRTTLARQVIVALPRSRAAELLGELAPALIDDERVVTARAACLTVGLSSLPRPERFLALGYDEPSYLSVHSVSAKLAPDGGAVIHAAWYLPPEGAPDDVERRLEERLDRMQPGWRDVVVERWWLPDLAVAPVPRASAGGFAGRPSVRVQEVPGLFLAGDFVGPEGILADASVASGLAAAELVRASREASLARREMAA